MNKANAKRSAVLASAAAKTGGMFVFAATDAKLLGLKSASTVLSKVKYTEHSCAECGTKFGAPAIASTVKYFCPCCGSGKVEAGTNFVKPKIQDDKQLIAVKCGGCGTHNVTAKAIVASTKELSCTTCGTSMGIPHKSKTAQKADYMDEDFDVVDDLDMSESVDLTPEADDLDLSVDLDTDLETDVDFDDMEMVDIEDDLDDDDVDGLFDSEVAKVKKPVKAAEDGQDMPSSPDGVNTNETPSDAPLDMNPAVTPAEGAPENGPSIDVSPTPPATIDLVQEFESTQNQELNPENDQSKQMAFVYLGEDLAIVGNRQILATLTAADAGEHAGMMQTKQFQIAVAHSLRTLGLSKTVANYGFKPSTVKVNIDKIQAKLIEEKAAAAKSEVTAKLDEMSNDFQQSLDIAAAGFAGNFWKNRHDPVKAALVQELSAAGFKSAERLVDRVFASHGVSQMRSVLEIARELADKDVEARNGLAGAINLSKYVPMQVRASDDESEDESEDETEDDQEDESMEAATVLPIGRNPETASVVTASSVSTSYKTAELRSILGTGSFS